MRRPNRFPFKKFKSEYRSWSAAKTRCYNKKSKKFPRYGGRGIKVCDGWIDSFDRFMTDMGPKPKGKSLERINNDGDYEPKNCKWATPVEQSNNTKNTKLLTKNGITMSISAWARELGISSGTIIYRLGCGMLEDQALISDRFYGKKIKRKTYR